ncbi:hypothetical protein GCM10011607_11650 [Shewanella inventionis]|uniref:DUF4868 domain-containing protein n=1 Tax=Shewanella inventionis TaxID=1738770 RepID=A0ABQ1IWG9_9GAMM|nr:hypothetical protein [Shewanella inventionis]GGB52818.1 hypothetical protein GCM10011607_11650 [Shewanella inventionis]
MLSVYKTLNDCKYNELVELQDAIGHASDLLAYTVELMNSNLGFSTNQIAILKNVPIEFSATSKVDVTEREAEQLLLLGFSQEIHKQVVSQAMITRLGKYFSDATVTEDLDLSLTIAHQPFRVKFTKSNLVVFDADGNEVVKNQAKSESEKQLWEGISNQLARSPINQRLDGNRGLLNIIDMTFLERLENNLVNVGHFTELGRELNNSYGLDENTFTRELRLLVSKDGLASSITQHLGKNILKQECIDYIDQLVCYLQLENIDPSLLACKFIEAYEYFGTQKWNTKEDDVDKLIEKVVTSKSFDVLTLEQLNNLDTSEFIERLRAVKFALDIDLAINAESIVTSYSEAELSEEFAMSNSL